VRLRNGQYRLSLYRDLVADYYEEILNAPIFVEKGPLSANNPLLFNQEDMTFNQIRQEPIKIADKSNIPWIVGYIPKDAFQENTQITADMNLSSAAADYEVEDLSDWEYFQYQEPSYTQVVPYVGYNYATFKQYDYDYQATNKLKKYLVSPDNYISETVSEWYGTIAKGNTLANGFYNNNSEFKDTYYYKNSEPSTSSWEIWRDFIRSTTYQSYVNGFVSTNYRVLNNTQATELTSLNGKIIVDTTANIFYKIAVNVETVKEVNYLTNTNEPTMFSNLNNNVPGAPLKSATDKTFFIRVDGYKIYLSLEQIQTKVFVNLGPDRYHLEDQPFDMFCIPYGDIILNVGNGYYYGKFPGTALATAIAEKAGSETVYDVQILPYCPIQGLLNDDGEVELEKTKYSLINTVDGPVINALMWCRESNFSFDIPFSIPDANNAIDKKVLSQTTMYRLVSPNYGSVFEFNPYKNGGVNFIRVDCSYKPFNPYIRIAPVFKNLYGYGGQYDARGLILNGDFSITQLSNAWANYELQNKNYQAIFDRQIKNLEVQNKYQRINDIVGSIAGTAQGGTSGAMTGAMMGSVGGPYGMAAGAAIGGTIGTVAAAAGGVADIYINEALRKEVLDMTKDQFGYQLGNIQALPTALSKTSVLTINNPLIPMLERYICSPEEETAFRNKLQYNGMTIMTIGTMGDYTRQKNFDLEYFKGKLIRIEGLADDSHVATAIASELNKGVYI